MKIEQTILKNLIYNEEYVKKVLPFLKDEYFLDNTEKLLFTNIIDFITAYNTTPTYETILIQLNDSNITENEYEHSIELLNAINESKNEEVKIDWLITKTEDFCKNQAIYNAIKESIHIIDGKSKTLEKGAIPKILSDALSISFDTNIGHDFIENWEDRYEYYHRQEEKIPFDLSFFNKITKNGFGRKSLNLFIGAPHSGKTLFGIHFTANYLVRGKNVLYITLEMSEEEIAKRIDANISNMTIDEIENLDKTPFEKYIQKLKIKTVGKLIIKQFPTGQGHVGHFNALINELRLKKNFVADVIVVDYLGICASIRYKSATNVNSYNYVKAISEELRGLAIEHDVPLISMGQLNRSGAGNSDPEMGDVSESFGLNFTGDSIFGIIRSNELKELGQVLVKQFKNRYRDMSLNNKFLLGVDTSRMKLYDLETSAQNEIVQDIEYKPTEPKNKFNTNFDDFKFE
jgi:replicative DNA helicase